MDIILYLSNGYPSLEVSKKMAKAYHEAGCKIIEVDFPSSNPYLEGEMIADRMKKALEVCGDYSEYMREIEDLHKEMKDVTFLILAYENTIKEIGVEKFIEFCKKNALSDILLVGQENEKIRDTLMKEGLKVSCYIQFQMLEEEIEFAKNSNGFVYMQAKPMSGQGYINENYPDLKSCISHLRKIGIDRPIYCGVGVHTPEDVKMVKEAGGDAAFVGSAILKLQDNMEAMKEKIAEFMKEC